IDQYRTGYRYILAVVHQSVERFEQRGLATARRPDDRRNGIVRYIQINILQNMLSFDMYIQILDLYVRCSRKDYILCFFCFDARICVHITMNNIMNVNTKAEA